MKGAPDPKDVLEFQFKQYKNLKIADGFESIPAACSLISVDCKRGLIYAACDNKITVIKSGNSDDEEWKREYTLPAKINHLSLNCDCSFLAIALSSSTAYIYNAASFTQQNLELLREIKSSSGDNVHILDLRWNPCIPGMLCTVTSDHTVGSFNITSDKNSAVLTVLEKLDKLDVFCVAWSPKGKQLVVGCKNGSLVQLKPDLKVARNIAGPNPSVGSVIALLWISNYQFCAAYFDRQESRINVIIVDAPKGEVNASFTCYEDITYGSLGVDEEEGGPRYYFEHISEWGLIVAASSGSSEVAVLGSRDNGTTWEQWQLVDHGRAQLPLVRTSESYPVGLAVDRTSVKKLPWGGEGSTLPHPVPILHIFGTSGQLCSFHMVNLMAGIPAICSPPTETLPSSSQPRASLAPSEISFNLVGTVTSTPRPKQIEAMPDRSKAPAAPANLFVDSSRVPVSVPVPVPVPVASPRPLVELNVPKMQMVKFDSLPKAETLVAPSKEIKQDKVGIDSDICIHTYEEESSLFEKELASRKEVQVVDIGTATERNEIIEKSEEMDQFLSELKETTAGLTSDISYLKNLLLKTFNWLEETKSRSSSNASYNLQSHGDNHKLKELQHLMRYVQSQREEVTRVLDDEWLEHMSREKIKMKIPRLDSVYQIMLQQSQITAEKRNLINALVKNWKALTRGDVGSSLNKSMANMSLSTMPPGINRINGVIEQRCKAIAIKNYSFSREKQSKLRNILIQSQTKVIKSVTPSAIQNRLEAMLSSLATKSPLKVQVQAPDENKVKFLPKAEATVTPNPSVQAAKTPLASLDRIVANIGSGTGQLNITLQNKGTASPGELAATSVTTPVIGVRQAQVTLQTPALEQAKQNKPITISLFGTPQTSHKSGLGLGHGGATSGPLYEVSPFTSHVSKTSAPPSLPPGLSPTPITKPSFALGAHGEATFGQLNDVSPFTSHVPKTSAPPSLPPGLSPTPITKPSFALGAHGEATFGQLNDVSPFTSHVPKTSAPLSLPPGLSPTPITKPSSKLGVHGEATSGPLNEVSPFTSHVSKMSAAPSLPPGFSPTPITKPSLALGVHGEATSGPIHAISPPSPFTSKMSTPASLPPGLPSIDMTGSSTVQPFSKPDTFTFIPDTTKADESVKLPISIATSPPTTTSAAVSSLQSQTSLRTSGSIPSSASSPPANQVPSSYPTAIGTSPTAVTTASKSVTTLPMQKISLASQPVNNTAFPSTSKTATSPPSNVAQSPDLSALSLSSQAPSNTTTENVNVTPLTSGIGNSVFASTGGSSCGSIFGGTPNNVKEKPQGTNIFGNLPTSSIFSGTVVGGSTASMFGGGVTAAPPKPPAYGSSPAVSPGSLFGGSSANSTKPIVSETPVTSPPTSGFANLSGSSSASIFGNASSISNSQSIFGGNTAALSSAPAPSAVASGFASNPVKPSTMVAGASASSPTSSNFSKPLDAKPTAVGVSSPGPAASSPFGTGSAPPSNTTIFGGSISNTPSASIFGGSTSLPPTASMFGGSISNPPTASIFGGGSSNSNSAGLFSAVQPGSQNQPIFGGAVSSSDSATNVGTISQTTPAVPTFGQAAAFGGKPAFGSLFGASKPLFGGAFGNTGIPIGSQPTGTLFGGGFNSGSLMGGNVFGESSGSSTFEKLANQECQTFGVLAQNQAEPTPAPEIPRGTSFNSWR